jgi:hypothetical protein
MSGGSQGVWWLDGERVLRYEQWMNPGGYQLAEWRPRGPEDPCARPEDVRAAISTGIAARDLLARWGARYGQGDDADRLLIEYLGLPCLGRMDEIHTTGVVTRLLREQDGSVWPLARALRSAPDAGARRRILRVLADFGARAKPVAHEIVTLLDDPQGLRVRDVLEALVPIAWPGSRDACRDVLAKGTLEDASFAAQVLSVLKDEELARRIVARLPERPASSADGPWLWRLVGLLDGCDHARAATYAVRWKDEELFDHSYRETFRRIAAPSGPK